MRDKRTPKDVCGEATLSLNNTSFDNLKSLTMADPGEGPGGPRPPYYKTKLKTFLETAPPLPLCQGLDPALTQVLQFPTETIVFSFFCARNKSN